MEYHPRDRRGVAPWVWVLVVLAAIILIFVVWWAVAAQPTEETVIVPPAEREREPVGEPAQQQPVVVERERPVNIYIERDQPRPNVIIVPRDEQPAMAQDQIRQVDLPSLFRYMDRTWEPTEQTVSREDEQLVRTGASIDGNAVYAREDATQPYDELFVEAEPGSGIYVRYRPE